MNEFESQVVKKRPTQNGDVLTVQAFPPRDTLRDKVFVDLHTQVIGCLINQGNTVTLVHAEGVTRGEMQTNAPLGLHAQACAACSSRLNPNSQTGKICLAYYVKPA